MSRNVPDLGQLMDKLVPLSVVIEDGATLGGGPDAVNRAGGHFAGT